MANLSKDSCKEFLQCGKFWKWLVFGTIAVKISSKLIRAGHRFVVNKLADIPPREIKHEKDVVYLYMFPRAIYKGAPNVSPYSVKVETWLRMNNIKYEASASRLNFVAEGGTIALHELLCNLVGGELGETFWHDHSHCNAKQDPRIRACMSRLF